MADMLFGWELTYKNVESSLENNTDVLVAFIHFILLKNKFRCVGIGDDKTLTEADKQAQSELLPEGWNHMGGIYKLRYICNDKLYVLHALLSEDLLIANMLDAETLRLSNVAFVLDEIVTKENRTAANAIKAANETCDKLMKDLVEPVFSGTQVSTQTQTEPKRDPLQVGPSMRPYRPNPELDPFPGVYNPVSPFDPFGGGGGGNLFEPPRRPSVPLPPGHPPGGRFDPFGPPGGSFNPFGQPRRPGRFEPNPDHFRPPGFDDII